MSKHNDRVPDIASSVDAGMGIHLVKNSIGNEFIEDPEPGPTILLVEDESFVREVTREVLRSAGYVVVAVRTAAEAMRVLEEVEGSADLLLTDVVLPGESGIELAIRLKQQNQDQKVLYITGYAVWMKRCDEQQERFLAKPFSSKQLLVAVNEVLSITGGSLSGMAPPESGLSHLGRDV